MERREVRPEFQSVLDEFVRIRNAYVALKSYCEAQEEVLTMEKNRSSQLKENLEKVTNSCLAMEKRHKVVVERLEKEKTDLHSTVKDLQEQCDHLRLVSSDRSCEEGRIGDLREELEVLKAHLVLQEEKHSEDLTKLNQKHSDEIQKYKMLLQSAKQGTSSRNTKRGRGKGAVTKDSQPLFRWPHLDIERVNSTPAEKQTEGGEKSEVVKKRKLFHEDTETLIDIL